MNPDTARSATEAPRLHFVTGTPGCLRQKTRNVGSAQPDFHHRLAAVPATSLGAPEAGVQTGTPRQFNRPDQAGHTRNAAPSRALCAA